MSNLPSPLVSPDVDLTDFPFMPVDVRRLLTSDTWLKASVNKAVGFSSINLWFESWHQKPAASLPNNDAILARMAMCTNEEWASIKDDVLKGWIVCSDGRLYHPVVAEKALESFIEKLMQRYKGGCGNAKHWGTEFDPVPVISAIYATREKLRALNPNSRALKKKPPIINGMNPTGNSTGNSTGISSGTKNTVLPQKDTELPLNYSTGNSTGTSTGYSTGISSAIPQQSQETETRTVTRIIKDSCAELASPSSTPDKNSVSNTTDFLTPQIQQPLLPAPKVVLTIIQRDGNEFPVTDDFITEMAKSFPNLDIEASLLKAKAWCFARPSERKTARGMKAFLTNWLIREVDNPRISPQQQLQRGAKITAGKWSDFDKKDYSKGVNADGSF